FRGDDAAGEVVGAGAATILGQRERAQPHLRGLVERLHQQRPRARLQALRLEGGRLDYLHNEIADRVADLQLLRTEVKVVHSTSPICCSTTAECCVDGDGEQVLQVLRHPRAEARRRRA